MEVDISYNETFYCYTLVGSRECPNVRIGDHNRNHVRTHSNSEKEWKLAQSNMESSSSGLVSAANELSIASINSKSALALAAASSPLGVITSALAGHGGATLLAVLGALSLEHISLRK
ncbi:hypothetical protein C2S51_024482 [Perilla frutescens var. frutescens]|nr:hypothetical protein C2S51_024482 [Perilla frutescens var. frutescens]